MTTIKGIIIPASWDENGNALTLAVATQDEEEYLIEDVDQIKLLKPFLQREVFVQGVLKTKKTKNIIDVCNIKSKG